LIQISTPIDAQSPPVAGSSIHEGGNIEGSSGNSPVGWRVKAQKKNKPGIFAKLLDGLTAKVSHAGNTAKLKQGNSEIDGIMGLSGPEKAGKNLLNGISGNKKLQGLGIFETKDDFKTVNELFTEDLSAGNRDPWAEGIFRSAKKDGLYGSGSRNILNNNGYSAGTIAPNEGVLQGKSQVEGSEGDLRNSAFNINSNRSGKGIIPGTGSSGSDKAKSTGTENMPGNVVSFSFREMEAELFLSQNRPGRNAAAGGEKDRLAELRSKKGREKPGIEVRDARSGEVREAGNPEVSRGPAFNLPRPVITEIELPVDLNSPAGKGDGGFLGKAGKENQSGISFEDALAQELRGNLSTDIVRDAAVIVRNGGEGTIRLSLRPASLGDVKIRLEMTENKITGHIIVESDEALRAFERELPVLEKAFRDSGFSETNLEMSLAQNGGNYGAGTEREDGYFQTMVQAASLYESGTDYSSSDSFSPVEGPLSSGSKGQPAVRTQVNLLI